MVNIAHTTVLFFIMFVFGVSLLNPGGAGSALVIAAVIVAALMFAPFLQDYIVSVNKGKKARKKPDVPEKNNDGGSGRR